MEKRKRHEGNSKKNTKRRQRTGFTTHVARNKITTAFTKKTRQLGSKIVKEGTAKKRNLKPPAMDHQRRRTQGDTRSFDQMRKKHQKGV